MSDIINNSTPWDASQGCIHCFTGHTNSVPFQEKYPGESNRLFQNVLTTTAIEEDADKGLTIVFERAGSAFGNKTYQTIYVGDKVEIAVESDVSLGKFNFIVGTVFSITPARQFGEKEYYIEISTPSDTDDENTHKIASIFSSRIKDICIISRANRDKYSAYNKYSLVVEYPHIGNNGKDNQNTYNMMISDIDNKNQYFISANKISHAFSSADHSHMFTSATFDLPTNLPFGTYSCFVIVNKANNKIPSPCVSAYGSGAYNSLEFVGNMYIDHLNNLCTFLTSAVDYNTISVAAFGLKEQISCDSVETKPILISVSRDETDYKAKNRSSLEKTISDSSVSFSISANPIVNNIEALITPIMFETAIMNSSKKYLLFNYPGDRTARISITSHRDGKEYDETLPNEYINFSAYNVDGNVVKFIRLSSMAETYTDNIRIEDWNKIKKEINEYVDNDGEYYPNLQASLINTSNDVIPLHICPDGNIILSDQVKRIKPLAPSVITDSSMEAVNEGWQLRVEFSFYKTHNPGGDPTRNWWVASYDFAALYAYPFRSINLTRDRRFALEFRLFSSKHPDVDISIDESFGSNDRICIYNKNDKSMSVVTRNTSSPKREYKAFVAASDALSIDIKLDGVEYSIPFTVEADGRHNLVSRIDIEKYRITSAIEPSDPSQISIRVYEKDRPEGGSDAIHYITEYIIAEFRDSKHPNRFEVRTAGRDHTGDAATISLDMTGTTLENSDINDIRVSITKFNFASNAIFCPIVYWMPNIISHADVQTNNIVDLRYYYAKPYTIIDSSNSVFDHTITFSVLFDSISDPDSIPYGASYTYDGKSGSLNMNLVEDALVYAYHTPKDDSVPVQTFLGRVKFDENGVLQFTNYFKNCSEISAFVAFNAISPDASPRPEDFNIEEAEPATSDDITNLLKSNGGTSNE